MDEKARAEYYAAARWCAKRGIQGKVGDPLPENLSSEVAAEIADDPLSFELAIDEIHRTDCSCGSGEGKFPLKDGYGIFLTYACAQCEESKIKQFRTDIFDRYDTDETIESEENDERTPEQWLEDMFEFEFCDNCGGDAQHHFVGPGVFDRHAYCKFPPNEETGELHPTVACYLVANGYEAEDY